MKKYNGSLSFYEVDNVETRRAIASYYNQRQRCNNPKNPKYPYYGAIGIRVIYGSREFVGWWLHQAEKLNLLRPSVGRIDHSSNYCFENIVLEEMADNTKERIKRRGFTKTPVRVNVFDSEMNFLEECTSYSDASRKFGVGVQAVRGQCISRTEKRYTKCGYYFRHTKES